MKNYLFEIRCEIAAFVHRAETCEIAYSTRDSIERLIWDPIAAIVTLHRQSYLTLKVDCHAESR